jgi:hypothetical protein
MTILSPISGSHLLALATALYSASCAFGQAVVHSNEHLSSTRTEAWAMNYLGASTFMTSFGETPALAEASWMLAGDLGYIPKLTDAQQRVGLHGVKQEDLNKTQIFGRIRFILGLPGEFVAELGYTPPLSYHGVQPLDLFAFAIGRRIFERDGFTESLYAFGQTGRVQGDITCPARLAGIDDPVRNPYGCQAPSNDHVFLNYYGAEATSAWTAQAWHAHASLGVVRTEFAVEVDALTFSVNDRSRLVARGYLPFATLGGSWDLDRHWNLGAEVLYVPLRVQREIDGPTTNDPLTSVRVQLVYRFD